MTPKDEYRYGYRLWIDDSTAMPLRTQLCDAHGHVIEQIVFASSRCPRASLTPHSSPKSSTEGFQWLRNDAAAAAAADGRSAVAWSAMRLPPGFRMTMRSAQTHARLGRQPVDHMVFTDGFASVSVFVETQQSGRGTQNGRARSPPRSAPRPRSRPWSTATR